MNMIRHQDVGPQPEQLLLLTGGESGKHAGSNAWIF
jgi:hypothetical protein